MRKRTIIKLALLPAISFAGNAATGAENKIEETRTALEQWVEIRKLISEESTSWKVDKVTIEDTIELYKTEKEILDDKILKAEENMTLGEKERLKLNEEKATLTQGDSVINEALPVFEKKIAAISKRLPEKLQSDLEPLLKRLPKEGVRSRAALTERLLTIVGILGQIEKFDAAITVDKNSQKIPSGEISEVDTLYIGLSRGFYVNKKGDYAGILTPGPDGWVKTDRPDLASSIRDAIDVYQNQKLAEFVSLPFEIN